MMEGNKFFISHNFPQPNFFHIIHYEKEKIVVDEKNLVEIPEAKQISSIVKIGEGFLELIEPTDPDGVAGKFLREKGGGLHHISLLCEDAIALCEGLEAKGIKIINKITNGPYRGGFIHPKSSKGILFELKDA